MGGTAHRRPPVSTAMWAALPFELQRCVWAYWPAAALRNLAASSRAHGAWAREILRARGPQVCFVFTSVDSAAAPAGTGGRVHALDLRTGATRWDRPLPGAGSMCTPAVSQDRRVVYVCTYEGEVRALDVATGACRWRCRLGRRVCQTRLLLRRGHLLARTLDGRLAKPAARRARALVER